MQGTRHDLLGAALRHRRVHEQQHRRDQVPDRLHGRLPAHDGQGARSSSTAPSASSSRGLVRSPGAYFESSVDKTTDKDIFSAKIIPSRGAWLEFEVDKRDQVGVRLDRKRKQSVTVLLKALGWTESKILEEFGEFESIRETLAKDTVSTQEEAPLDIYKKLRPAEPATAEAARNLLNNLYFNPKRYDLAKVGRYKVNRKLGVDAPLSDSVLSVDDIAATIRYLVSLHAGVETTKGERDGEEIEVRVKLDDIDHFGNRRIRAVGELIENQVRTGLSRMERVVRERMTTQDVEAITPQTLINIRPVVAAIKEFFGTSQLSQFMDQNNPLAGLTHKRRLSALGPGGLSRDRAAMEVRDVHPSHYGRMCPIETPEGPNIGLIGSLASYARINPFGFIETPYRKVVDGVVTDETEYLTADDELDYNIAQANAPLTDDQRFAEEEVLARPKGGGGKPSWCSATRSTSWTSPHVRWCPSPRRSSRSSSTTTRTAPSWVRTCSVRLCRWSCPRPPSWAPAWSTVRPSTPATSSSRRRRASSPRSRLTSSPSSPTTARCRPTGREVQALEPRHVLQPAHHRRRGRPRRGRCCARRRTVDGERRDGSRQEPPRRVHVVGGLQLRGRDHPLAAPRPGRRPLLDPHRGARGRRPRHEARCRGDHPGHPEHLARRPGRPRRSRHHPHRRRGHRRRHPRRQGHPEG